MKKLIACLFLVLFFVFTPKVFADNEIETSQSVAYTVTDSGTTNVKHTISLTNLTTNYYVSEYSITLGYTNINNISAADPGGAIITDVNKKDDSTELVLHFNSKVVGKGKTLAFTLNYDTSEIAVKHGTVWEVEIPRIKNTKDLVDYSATLIVPSNFGNPTYVKPADVTYTKNTNSFTFQKNDIEKGINISFGTGEIYDYNLSYHIHNSRLYPILTEIALPPTMAYQEVLLDSLTPRPQRLYRDSDGNWLAKYRLNPSETVQVIAKGKIKVSATNTKKEVLDEETIKNYLQQRRYWEVTDSQIIAKAQELKTPDKIYQYVVSTLTYDYNRIDKDFPRAGAKQVLQNPSSAICMEFTDLFIALSRAAGIPAREIDGFAYTQNTKLRPIATNVQDILHAWPEYYDQEKQMWIAVDPTWGNTTGGLDYFNSFDFNHVGFVIKATDSEYPNPAGSYKDETDKSRKDVDVTFAADPTFTPETKITIGTNLPDTLVAGFTQTNSYFVNNIGNAQYDGGLLRISSSNILPDTTEKTILPIPPLGTQEVTATIHSPKYTDSFTTDMKAQIGKDIFSYKISILPIYIVYFPLIGGVLGVILVAIIASATWHLYIQRRQRTDSLRRESEKSS